LWDVATRRRITDLPDHIGLTTVAFSPDGKLLAVGNMDGTIKLWDVTALMRRAGR
jgi:WD40 repeat protein